MYQRTAIITGLGTEIGFACARHLLEKGWRVGGFGDDAGRLADLEFEGGRQFLGFRCDMKDPGRRAQAFAELGRACPVTELIVLNAPRHCLAYATSTIEALTAWSTLMEVNSSSAFELARALLPNLLRSCRPTIINVSSSVAAPPPHNSVDRVTEALRAELEPQGIRVGGLASGIVGTPIYDELEGVRELDRMAPTSLRAEDIAECVEWMAERPVHVNMADVTLLPSPPTSYVRPREPSSRRQIPSKGS